MPPILKLSFSLARGVFSLLVTLVLLAVANATPCGCICVSTASGVIIGHHATNKTGVIEFLGIPYAATTNGSSRWMPPQRFNSDAPFNASVYVSLVSPEGGEGISLIMIRSRDRWNIGGSKSTIYNGQYLAEVEDIIVVTINYRLNIFGFPGAPGIQQNVGLLDQRMALEWLRDNIAAFGGDNGRITVFGQSAGSVSVGYMAYAYPDDPIVAGYIMESGTPHSWTPLTPDLASEHWYNASSTLGCGASGNILDCMQSKNTSEVLAAFAKVSFDPTNALYQPQFQPVEDNITVFYNYTALAAAGHFAKLPLLIGNTNFESGFYQIAAFATGKPFNDTQQHLFNLEAFTCATALEAASRAARNVSVYRYQYFGDFPNLRLSPNSSTYHGSELEMIFGTAEDVSSLPNTADENEISAYFMKAWVTFARDPTDGLNKLGWPKYVNSNATTLVRLGYENEVTPSFVGPFISDAECASLGGAVDLGKGAM